jgi:hypothetical protein
VAHGRRLAGELEIMLDLAGGGHDAGFSLRFAQVVEDLDLTGGEVVCHGSLNSVLENKFGDGGRQVKHLFRTAWKSGSRCLIPAA